MYLEKPVVRQPQGWLLILAIINGLLVAGVNLWQMPFPTEKLSMIYIVAAMTIHFSTIALIISAMIGILHLIVRPQKWRYRVSVFIFSLANLIVITNLKVYSLYHFHLNGMVVNLLLGGALLENIAFSWIMWGSIAGLILGVMLVQWVLLNLARTIAASIHVKRGRTIGLILSAMIGLQLLNGFADALGWHQVISQNRQIPWMQTTTMRSSLKRMGFEVIKTNKNVLPKEASGLQYPRSALQCLLEKPLNIVMLVVDSLRADVLTPDIMPNLFALKSEAIDFENHYSSSNSTRYGLFSLMYGLPGHYWKPILAEERGSLLFDQTIQHHYQHFIYGSSKLTFPEFDRTIFSNLRDKLVKGSTQSSAENDEEITQRFLQNVESLDPATPFFGFLFYDSPHAFSLPQHYQSPFQPMLDHVNYMELNNHYDGTAFFNRYKATAHYVDSLIIKIVNQLRAKNLMQNTVVIITSDHGQEFNETKKNYWGHNGNFSKWQTKVPLLMLWPEEAGRTVSSLSSHEDIVPSLLTKAFGCSTPTEDYSTGKNLFIPIEQDRALLMENWTDRAIFYKNNFYLIDPVGNINAVDENYNSVETLQLPAQILQNNLEQMSRFLKH